MTMLPLGTARVRGFFLIFEAFRGLTLEQKLLFVGLLILAFVLILRALGFFDHAAMTSGQIDDETSPGQ